MLNVLKQNMVSEVRDLKVSTEVILSKKVKQFNLESELRLQACKFMAKYQVPPPENFTFSKPDK